MVRYYDASAAGASSSAVASPPASATEIVLFEIVGFLGSIKRGYMLFMEIDVDIILCAVSIG